MEPSTPKNGTSSSVFNSLHTDYSNCYTTSLMVEENDTCPMSSGLLWDDKHSTIDTLLNYLLLRDAAQWMICRLHLVRRVASSSFFNLWIQVTPYGLIHKSLLNEEPWITNESCYAIQQDDLESAQELACVYPEPLSTFQDIFDSYHQNSAEEC